MASITSRPNEVNSTGAGLIADDHNPSTTSSETKTIIVPFDGMGKDPGSLVGRRIQWYHTAGSPQRLEFKCIWGRLQFLEESTLQAHQDGCDYELDYEVRMDSALEEALESLRGRRDESLTIVEAALGQRTSLATGIWDHNWWKMTHRVIGIRCEGMEKMGYIYCIREIDGDCSDNDDIENYIHMYGDVVLAQRRIVGCSKNSRPLTAVGESGARQLVILGTCRRVNGF